MPNSLHKKILEGLEGVRDHDLFERCVCGLLRSAYPTLVHIHGGQDAGMDGVAAGGPVLIATTGEDVTRNLTENIDSHLSQWGEHAFDRFVFATSRDLTPPQRHKLHDRAREKGVELEQTYDRQNLADLLYDNPRWRIKLLGIPGDAPALSEVPRSRRPLLDLELVGREADLEWLRSTRGDRLLFGEPGSGKTFLLLQLVREGKARFLARKDWGAVRDAYLEERPAIIIVDDAHLDPEQLDRLRQVRQDIDAEFEILATCWLGEKDQVAEALRVTSKNMRRLELLTRKEILEVLEQAGVRAKSEYMGDLIDQSANKPGLAVTLASLWLRGEWQGVLTGQALRRSLIGSLTRVLGGEDPTLLLASFALGGDRGVTLDLVAEATGWNPAQVWDLAVRKIAASGVLAPRGKETLAVEPRVLRYALLKEVFFSSLPAPFDYRDLLEKAPSTASGVENLVLAVQRGVEVPRWELLAWVRKAGSDAAWESLAYVDRLAALWSLENYPGPVEVVARAALRHSPSEAIQRLLKSAETASSDPDASSQPMDDLKTWLKQIEATEELLRRRRLVMQAAKTYLESGGQKSIGLTAIFAALALRLERDRRTPDRMGVTYQMGHLPVSAVEHVYRMWTEVRDSVTELDEETWPSLANAVEQWVRPSLPGKAFSDEELQRVWSSARRLLQDLVPLAEGSPGLTAGLTRLAQRIDGFDLGLATDPVFETLFPLWTEQGEGQRERALALALEWSKREPQEVASKLKSYEDEAAKIHHGSSRLTVTLCHALVESVDRPEPWLSAFLDQELPAELVLPFLEKTIDSRQEGWELRIQQCLDIDAYALPTATMVLRLDPVPEAPLDTTLERLKAYPQGVETACLLGQVPLSTLRRLFSAAPWNLALAAAIGEWQSGPEMSIREEVQEEWRRVILRAKTNEYKGVQLGPSQEYWLRHVLTNDPVLAVGWLQSRFQDQELPRYISESGPFAAAVAALDTEQKLQILGDLERLAESPDRQGFVGDLLGLLVESPDLYQHLLASSRLERFRFTPLERPPWDESWQGLAECALDAGIEPRQVAERSFCLSHSYAGAGVEYWGKWETAFAKMEKTAEDPLLEVARHGLRIAREKIETAKQEQRQYELTGHY